MSADNQTAMYLDETLLAKAMTSDLEKVEGKYVYVAAQDPPFPSKTTFAMSRGPVTRDGSNPR